MGALGRLGDGRAVEPLLACLDDVNANVRAAPAEALGRLGDERAVAPLIACSRDGGRDLREAAVIALGRLGTPQALTVLHDLLTSIVRDTRLWALEGLSHTCHDETDRKLLTKNVDWAAAVPRPSPGRSGVLFGRQLIQAWPTEAVGEGGDVDEIARLGAGEQRQHLVRSEFLQGQHCRDWGALGRADPCVVREVYSTDLGVVRDLQLNEPGGRAQACDGQALMDCRLLDGACQPMYRSGTAREEVQIFVVRLTSPRVTSAAPPASANPSASGREEIRPISRRWRADSITGGSCGGWPASLSVHVWRTWGGRYSSSHSSMSASRSMKKRMSSSVPSWRTCSYTRARSRRLSRS